MKARVKRPPRVCAQVRARPSAGAAGSAPWRLLPRVALSSGDYAPQRASHWLSCAEGAWDSARAGANSAWPWRSAELVTCGSGQLLGGAGGVRAQGSALACASLYGWGVVDALCASLDDEGGDDADFVGL